MPVKSGATSCLNSLQFISVAVRKKESVVKNRVENERNKKNRRKRRGKKTNGEEKRQLTDKTKQNDSRTLELSNSHILRAEML